MYKNYIKRALDFALALLGGAFLLFPLLIIALAIRTDSRGPALFRQERVGKDGKVFLIYKFRTMVSTNVSFDAEKPVIEDDNVNLTRVGRVIRRFKIDEFPQLINVLKGEMALIGPRPLMPVYLDGYKEWEMEKFTVKPGLSGLAQIRGNGHLSAEERSYYDVVYARKVSFALDTEILFKTAGVVLFGEEKYLRHVDAADMEKTKGGRKE